ncbi:hypothetical protein HYH03_008598 [Edaphochlamys debaryana]|uniref:Endoplasmic reticulum transmembrane protein n=1 Tax=Edaphochlamys debaryana TaxID=47281 RepID=A0A835Y0U9_9CHLO|nr:hypothetical protein HYH03_008598 [Edaphochlamys debaryana]|eukprot:KAG2493177.1 hypothetical protein HYH03_008598 [Edaphochlamys debaryana]
MDTIFALPLFILACAFSLLTALHLIPGGLGLGVSQALKGLRKNAATSAVLHTIAVALGLLGATSLWELSKGADPHARSSRGEVLATVDYLRIQVSCALSLSNLLLLLLNLALSTERCGRDFAQKNLEAMQRQVKGLQAEYNRVTSTPAKGAAVAAGDAGASAGAEGPAASLAAEEAAALKKTVDKLIAEKQRLQAAEEEAEKAAKAAQARVTAMVSQIKGFDKEFDRLLDENKALKAKLAMQQGAGAGPGPAAASGLAAAGKKDE